MSIANTRDDLVTTFLSEWTSTPVAVQNIKYEPTGVPYVLVQLAVTLGSQPCLGRDTGATWERDIGDCILNVFVPVNYSGDGLALAESARRVLSQRRINETITDTGYTIPAGIAPDQRYYLYLVRIPYRTDNIKTEA